jgi:hypothetical protein
MWETVEAASAVLILCSTIGYLTACMILLIHRDIVPLARRLPRTGQVLLAALSIINVLAGVGASTAAKPNVGSMTLPLGFLPYVGMFAIGAAPLGFLKKPQHVTKWLTIATVLILGAGLLTSLAWIVLVWLSALLDYYQPYLSVALVVSGVATLGLGLCARNRARLRQGYSVIRTIFFLVIVAEATLTFFLANALLLVFLGSVLNP